MTVSAEQKRTIVEQVYPLIDGGRYAVRRAVGDWHRVDAQIFVDGHDEVGAWLLYRPQGNTGWSRTPMEFVGQDVFQASFQIKELKNYEVAVEGQVQPFLTWQSQLAKRYQAGQDLNLEMQVGAALLKEALPHCLEEQRKVLKSQWLPKLEAKDVSAALQDELRHLVAQSFVSPLRSSFPQTLHIVVEPDHARFSSWYELFPRSFGGLKGVTKELDRIQKMGFDILYLPPIHPIGRAHRKGKNNTLEAKADDVGSPWAIGAKEGGHKAIHPDLGNTQDFKKLVKEAKTRGIRIALDLAFQCSPDHPYVSEHPQWFKQLPDGSIRYAENPPKKYQDIYPFDFESDDWDAMWKELISVVQHWVDLGVEVFRVDNPHTKSFAFWKECIEQIRSKNPAVIFLAEAFTKPSVMKHLAKIGFNQSYTYFTWKNAKWEIEEYLRDLYQGDYKDTFRPNFWPNTPDILHASLQTGRRAMFELRAVLAATASPNYGVYGPAFELMEHLPAKPGSEEYLHSEKYEIRDWNTKDPASLAPLLERLNTLRREYPALQHQGLELHTFTNDQVICFSRDYGNNHILVIINLDAENPQSGWTELNLNTLGVAHENTFRLTDLLTGKTFSWSGNRNFVELNPQHQVAHVFLVEKAPS